MRLLAFGGLAAGSLILSSAVVAQDRCSQLSVEGVRPGVSVDDVRAALRATPTLSHQVVMTGGARVTIEDYSVRDGSVHVQYDGPLNRGATRVAQVWQPMRPTEDTVASLLDRLGEPDSGRDALDRGLEQGAAVWIEPMCDQVITYYRRRQNWIADDVSTVLLVERLSRLGADSPAGDAVRTWQASSAVAPVNEIAMAAASAAGPSEAKALEAKSEVVSAPEPVPSAPVPSEADASVDAPARVVRHVEAVYPKNAQEQGVTGVVKLRVLVLKSGKVGIVRVADVEPEGYGFEEAAVAAAERWKFAPAKVQGRAVEEFTDVTIAFP